MSQTTHLTAEKFQESISYSGLISFEGKLKEQITGIGFRYPFIIFSVIISYCNFNTINMSILIY